MYDMHYDLLTILYYNLKKNNPKSNIKKLTEDLINMYEGNIKGGIINLYFMSEEEMEDELGITKDELTDVKKMLNQSIKYLKSFQECNIIPKDIDYIYSVEGCDFLTSEKDLVELYNLGVRSIIPVWNTENKFGSGNRTNKGLTEMGVKLIEKAIELGIIIDISHANEKTFFDIMEVIKKNGDKNINLMASHSNVRTLCDRQRNLTDEQLTTLKDNGGYIGLFTNGNFISLNNREIPYEKRLENFIKHLKYLIEVIGFSTKKIIISTDDMNFNPDPSYHHLETYPIQDIANKLRESITKEFGNEIAEDILINNSKKLINNVKNNIYTNDKTELRK